MRRIWLFAVAAILVTILVASTPAHSDTSLPELTPTPTPAPTPAPVPIPWLIWFNWGTASGAVTMYDPCSGQPLDTPEFRLGALNNPAAYVRGNFITVKVRFISQAPIETQVGATGSFGGLPPQMVVITDPPFVSDWVEFTTVDPIPDSIAIHNVRWGWSSDEGYIGDTEHQVYAINKEPLTSKVYRELAEWTTDWCTGLPDDAKALADAILNGFDDTGVIKYGSPGWDTAEILCTGDGMCGGMKEVFYDALGTQGIHVSRFCYILKDVNPRTPEKWHGIVVQAPGLGRTEPTFSARTCRWVDEEYPLPSYFGDLSPGDDVAVETKKVYTFYAPNDGHCVNLLSDNEEVYLYDLSFGTGPWPDTFDSIPASGYYQGEELHDFRANYHDYAVDHMQGKVHYRNRWGKFRIGTYFDVESLIIPDKVLGQDQMQYYFSVVDGVYSTRSMPAAADDEVDRDLVVLLDDETAPVDLQLVNDKILSLERSAGNEEFLVRLLQRESEVELTQESGPSGAMPPLETLKAAAIAKLAEWGAKNRIPEIQQVAHTTADQLLRAIAQEACDALSDERLTAQRGFEGSVDTDLLVLVEDESAPVDWLVIRDKILSLEADDAHKDFLARLLAREAGLELTPGIELPGAMPPLEMLKAAAIMKLQDWGAEDKIPEIQQVADTTTHQVLRDIAREAVNDLR